MPYLSKKDQEDILFGIQEDVVYHTIDEYISDSHSGHDESFFNRLGRIIRFGKGVRK